MINLTGVAERESGVHVCAAGEVEQVSDSGKSAAALRASGIVVAFGGVFALNDVSVAVTPGEVFSIIGPNGAGKSTLLNVMSGVVHPRAGHVEIDGVRMVGAHSGMLARQRVARTFQNLALFKGLNVIDNVLMGRHVMMRSGLFANGFSWPTATSEERSNRAAAYAALQLVGIDSFAEARVGTLPYGIQKRIELARALSLEPRLLLLDEPMAGMTPAEKRSLMELIRKVHRERGITIVLIEHDMGVVMSLSDRIAVLDHGVKIAEGTPVEIRKNPLVISAYLGESFGGES